MFYFLFSPIFFLIFRAMARVLGRLVSSGEENVPAAGPVIYCPNHLSDSDPPTVFATLPRRAWFVAKDELRTVPVLGWVLDHGHVIFIKRDSADRKALRRCEEVLKRGEPLVIFPEGRCAQEGRLLPIQPGAAMLALRTGAPIVPIGVRNTNEVLPYGTLRLRFARDAVRLTFGRPIDPGDYAHMPRSQAIEAITADLTKALSQLSGFPEPETPKMRKSARQTTPLKRAEALSSLDIL